MVVKWSRDCEKACFTYHCPEAHWCDTGVGQSTSGGLARRWRRAVGKKSPGICRSDVRQRASGSESAALQSLRKFVPFCVACYCYSGNSAGQVRTAALAGDLICETLPAAKAGRIYVEIVGRRSRYHSPFVSHRCDKSPETSSQPRHLLPVPTPPAPVPVTRYPETFGEILYRRKSIRKGLL